MAKAIEDMTESELDAELRANGIDPVALVKRGFDTVCNHLRIASTRIAKLERDLADARKALQYADVVLTTLSDEYPMEICSGLRSTQRMVRAITAPPEPPVTFKGFSGSLMVFSDSPLLAENHTPEPQTKEKP